MIEKRSRFFFFFLIYVIIIIFFFYRCLKEFNCERLDIKGMKWDFDLLDILPRGPEVFG